MPANERIFTEKNYVTINDLFLLVFTEVDEDSDYILRKINSEETTVLRSFYDTFYFKKEHQYHFDENGDSEDCDEYYGKAAFIIGKVEGDYIKLDKYVFQIDTNIYINRDLSFWKTNYFYKYPNISLIKILSKYTKEDIYVDKGQTQEKGHINKKIFDLFRKSIPSSNEIQNYKFNEIDMVLRDYFNDSKDYQSILEELKNKRINFDAKKFMAEQIISFEEAGNLDLEKYRFILENIKKILNMNIKDREKKWQKLLLPYIRLLYPQYIYVIDEVGILDIKDINRRLDYLLVDYSGNIDIIELKVPEVDLLREKTYRDNFIESRELTGSVMQCEKYLYDLTANKDRNEEKISNYLLKKYGIKMDIQIIRPHATIIAGRSNKFDSQQINDFRIIKRKFSNIADIISYDDLIQRLERLIESVEKKSNQ